MSTVLKRFLFIRAAGYRFFSKKDIIKNSKKFTGKTPVPLPLFNIGFQFVTLL